MIWGKLKAHPELLAYATGGTRPRFDRRVREVAAELAAHPWRGRPCNYPLWQQILITRVYRRSAQPMQWSELTLGIDDRSVSRTVRRILKLFERVGFVQPPPLPGGSPAQIVDTTLIPSGRPRAGRPKSRYTAPNINDTATKYRFSKGERDAGAP